MFRRHLMHSAAQFIDQNDGRKQAAHAGIGPGPRANRFFALPITNDQFMQALNSLDQPGRKPVFPFRRPGIRAEQ